MRDKILVTGSMGFIGTHVMKLLGERGVHYDVKKQDFMDINNTRMLKTMIMDIKPKAIIHLAAISNREDTDNNPELALKTNIIGSFNIMRIAKEYGVRVIVASSAATAEPDRSIYGMSKEAMEHLAHRFDNVVVARMYNVYGPGGKGVINKWIEEIKQDKTIHLNGNTTRDYIWVEDVARALIELADDDVFKGTWEIGTGKETSLEQLHTLMSEVFQNKTIGGIYKDAKDEIQQSFMDGTPWFKVADLKEGIRRLL